MKLLIKILGQTKQYPALRVDFGTGYTFPWSDAHKAYVYAPKSQKEIDEIFASQAVHSVWFFAPVLVDETSAPADKADPAPAAPPASEKTTPEADAEIKRLQGLLNTATGTIAMLRADLKAQQEKASVSKKQKGSKSPTDSPAPDLAPE